MKRCPSCNQTYQNDEQVFCSNDGTRLVSDEQQINSSFDPMATILSPPPSVTSSQPPPSYDPTPYNPPPPAPMQSNYGGSMGAGPSQWSPPPPPQPFGQAQGQEKGMATGSLILSIVSFFCFGIVTAPIAIVLGVMALNKAKADPARYGAGKGLATAGIIIGSISILLNIIIVLVALSGGFR